MRFRHILVSILCVICFLTTGYVAEGSSQLAIEVPNLLTDLRIDWRPIAGSSLSFSVKVTKPPHYSGGRLTATLSEVTDYLGSCGNKTSIYNDLELRQNLIHNSGWRVESSRTSLSHPIEANSTAQEKTEWMTLRVHCEDYAAYGKLTFATTGSSIAEAAPYVITIPRDVNGNKIADGWLNDETTADPTNNNPSKNYAANWDEESGPPAPNGQRGDGLAVLDEYRGLYVNGTWKDTDPEGWDVFIWSESGIGYADSLPNMQPHSMSSSEVDYEIGLVHDFKIVYTPLHNMVYAIRLKNNPIPYDLNNPDNDIFGEMGLGPPSSGTYGDIFTDRIRGGLEDGQTLAGVTAYTVTHEIGHGVRLRHCPNGTDLNCYMWAHADDMTSDVTQYHSHHLQDYDLKFPSFNPQTPFVIPVGCQRNYNPNTGTWTLIHPQTSMGPPTPVGPGGGGPGDTNNQNTTNSENIISTNTGSSTYGCDYNAEYDYCTDTGTCTTRTDATGVGMCGHRWCCCAPAGTETSSTPSTSVTSTNTGPSTYGCAYNAEYDYCTDTGTCTTLTGSGEVGMCGHRWCCCAFNASPAWFGL